MPWANISKGKQIDLMPNHRADMVFECLECGQTYHIDQFLYICPSCKNLLKIIDKNFHQLKKVSGEEWRQIFNFRKMVNLEFLKGIFLSRTFRYSWFLSPCISIY